MGKPTVGSNPTPSDLFCSAEFQTYRLVLEPGFRGLKNVTILSLPLPLERLHIVYPHGQPRYYLLLTRIHSLLAPLFTRIPS